MVRLRTVVEEIPSQNQCAHCYNSSVLEKVPSDASFSHCSHDPSAERNDSEIRRLGQSRLQIVVGSGHDKNATDWNRRDCARDDGQNLAETGCFPEHVDERPVLAAHKSEHVDQDRVGDRYDEESHLAGEPDRQYCHDVLENGRDDS